MDHDQSASPDHPPPDHDKRASDHSNTVINSADMAAMVATANVNNMPGPIGGPSLNKRYRPAPAKTFQCRGYGECRMVFSRSEHLARHIRKHTGERPFSCHCGKQFSRLDNLRQHAQTVHADKQEQNERMMRDLTSLHATMAAANKGGSSRGGARRAPALPTLSLGPGGGQGEPSPNEPLNLIKQEDGGMSGMPLHQRPGTATGYEGEMIYGHSPSWAVQANEMEMQQQQHHAHHHHSQDARRPSGQHSFRGDPSQSFLASQSSSSQSSFRGQYAHFDGNGNGPLPSSSSRPPTSSGQSLPPLAAVVSASLPSPPLPSGPGYSSSSTNSQSGLQAFPFPGTLALRRPGTSSSRPGTAPSGGAGGASASFFNDGPPGSSSGKFGAYGGIGMGSSSSLLHSGFSSGRGTSSSGIFSYMAGYDSNSASSSGPGAGGHSGGSPTGGSNEPSPFYFQPPALDQQQQQQQAGSSPTSSNPRKRAFGAPDGPFEHNAPAGRESAAGSLSTNNNSVGLGVGSGFSGLGPLSAFGGSGEAGNAGYEYGTESRPQSRRLSVMELCNDDAQRQQQVHQATLASALVAAANERERYASNGSSVSSAAAYGNTNPNGHAATNGNGAGAGHAHGAAGVGRGGADGGAAGAAAHGAFLLPAAGAANAGAGGGGYGSGYGLSGAAASSSATGERPTTSSGLVSSASALHIFDGDSDSEDRARSGYQYGNGHGNGSGSGSASPPGAIYGGTSDATASSARGSIGDAVASGGVYSSTGASNQYAGGHSPAPAPASVGGSHSPPGVGYTTGGASGFYAASPALSVQHHHQHQQHHGQPTPTPSPHPGLLPAAPYALNASPAPSVYGTRPAGPGPGQQHHQQQQQQQYQFGGSPTFSGASSVASYASPRSPLSDGSAGSTSPFSSYAQPQHRAESVHHHPHHHQQQQQQHHQQQQYAGQQQYEQHAQQQYHHAGQYASQRVSPVQYDGAGYVYDADGVPRARGQFQPQQQQQQHSQHYTHDGRYEQHAHEQRYAGGHRHDGHEQQQHDIRISVSPHATPTFGMRV